MKQIVIINGSGGVGKDTFVQLCSKYTKVLNYSSVEEIKQIAKELGWTGSKTDKDRKFLSDLKLLTMNYNDFPFKCICSHIEQFLNSDNELMFIHIRDIVEIKQIIKFYSNIKTLLIRNKHIKPITTNIADANVENYTYDFIINNNDNIVELENKARLFVRTLGNIN